VTAATPRPWRVLYVEDDRVAALLFEEALRPHADFEVRVAESASEAIECVESWPPDALVIDAHLPDSDAQTLLPRLRACTALEARVPAVVLSADLVPEGQTPGGLEGFSAWWTKPVHPGDLPLALRQLLTGSRQ
jgi:CheY-like chemotaxis protein